MPEAASEPTAETQQRVLVAEDNPVNQKLAVAMLAKLGYTADVVGDGAQAVDAVTRTSYGAVLMDCEMPRMDGFQATAEIRSREEAASRIPIIAMTAAALKGDRERCLAAGMDDYVSKPVNMKELGDTVRRWIGDGTSPSEAGAPTADPVFPGSGVDPRRVAELRALSGAHEPSAFSEIAEMFLEGTPHRLKLLRSAVAEGDAGATEDTAHSLRGAAANIGAVRMAALCAELESLGRSGNLGGALDLLGRLDVEVERVQDALRAELEQGASPPHP